MKFRVTLQVVREMDMEIPHTPTPDAEDVSQAAEQLKESVEEDPFLLIESDDAQCTVTVEPV